ncbi:MAG: hypothetical protein AB7V46_18190 [Thermomicrobiales bacterium]
MQGRYRNGISEAERRRLIGCAFSGAIIAAPFLAFLVSGTLALAVLAAALATAGWFAFDISSKIGGSARRNLRILAWVNLIFLLLTIGALIWISRS